MRDLLEPFVAGIFIGVLVWNVYMLYRNRAVYEFFIELLEQVYVAAQNDLNNGRDWRWRLNEYSRLSYSRVLLLFWIPLEVERWWDDMAFLHHDQVKEKLDAKV